MGVHHLWQLLDEHGVGEQCNMQSMRGQTVAIDFSGWAVATDMLANHQELGNHPVLRSLFCRLLLLLRHGVKPVLVLEGKAPPQKGAEIQRRHYQQQRRKSRENKCKSFSSADRKSANATTSTSQTRADVSDINECRELCRLLGIPVIESHGEGEAMCAALNHTNRVDSCITNDCDIFLFGATQIYRNFKMGEDAMSRYSLKDIEKKVGLNREKLIVLGLLVGCDFAAGAQGIGIKTAHNLLKNFHSVNPIDSIAAWRDDEELDNIASFTLQTRPSHCSCCGHLGTKRKHADSGCPLCKLDGGCLRDNASACECDWHVDEREYAPRKTEIGVRTQALKDADFPDQQIVDLFLNKSMIETAQDNKMEFSSIDYKSLKGFVSRNLPGRVSEEKLISLLVAHHLLFANDVQEYLEPNKIVKTKREAGEELLVISWVKIAGIEETSVITTEVRKTFESRFPEIVEKFDREQLILGNLKKKRKANVADVRNKSKITDFFRHQKVRRKLAFTDNPASLSAGAACSSSPADHDNDWPQPLLPDILSGTGEEVLPKSVQLKTDESERDSSVVSSASLGMPKLFSAESPVGGRLFADSAKDENSSGTCRQLFPPDLVQSVCTARGDCANNDLSSEEKHGLDRNEADSMSVSESSENSSDCKTLEQPGGDHQEDEPGPSRHCVDLCEDGMDSDDNLINLTI